MAIRKFQGSAEYRAALANACEEGISSFKQSAEYTKLVAGAAGSSQGISSLEKRVASLEAALKKAKSKAHRRKKKNKKLAARVKELEGAGPGSGSSVAAKSPGTLATVMENPEAEDAEVSESHAKEMDNPDASTADAE